MYNPVTVEEMGRLIQELHTVIPKFGLTADTLSNLVRLYRSGLQDFDRETVDGAMRMMLRTEDKFPSLKLWRETCRTWLKHNRIIIERQPELDANGNDIVCATCRSVARWAILRMIPSQFSAPQTALRYGCDNAGEVMRRIAVCNPERHHTPHGISSVPENFIRWAE